MTLFSSLTNRIFLASALLAVATIGVAVYVVSARATREAETELRAWPRATPRRWSAQQQRALAARYVVFARLLADLPKLKAAVETQDPPTVEPIAADYQAAGRRRPAARHRPHRRRAGAWRRSPPAAIDAARSLAGALAGHEALAVPAAPARHPAGRHGARSPSASTCPDVLGTLSLGFLLDERLAEQFKRATQRRRVRAERPGARGRRCRATHVGLRCTCWPTSRRPTSVRVGDAEYVGLALPLSCRRKRHAGGAAVRSRPPSSCGRAPSGCGSCAPSTPRSPSPRLRAVLLATLLSYAVARTVTRPLGAITDAMREVAATGDLTRKITLRGPATGTTRTRGCWRRPSTRSPTRSRASSARPRSASGCSRSAGCPR